jgi:hypothetical protein
MFGVEASSFLEEGGGVRNPQCLSLLTGMTGISLHMAVASEFSVAWQFSYPELLVFHYGSN